jgi:hypothetical protein
MIKQQLAAQMGNMTPEEPAQMQELMGSFGLSSMIEPVAPATPALQQTGNAEYGGVAVILTTSFKMVRSSPMYVLVKAIILVSQMKISKP